MVFAGFAAPLNPSAWEALEFSSLKPNKVSGNDSELIISVDKSSSPLLLNINPPKKFKKIIAEGEIFDGQINLKDKDKQGIIKDKKSVTDDYALRLGLVLEGKNKKPPVPGFLLPSWVKKMFKMAPSGVGVDKIYFLNVANNANHVGDKRNHPLSKYLYEEVVTHAKTGQFKIEKTFKSEKELLGFWLSANGEGTGSKFKIKLTKIYIE